MSKATATDKFNKVIETDHHMFIDGPSRSVSDHIRTRFEKMKPGETLQIDAYCRGNRSAIDEGWELFFLPAEQDVPTCFDFKRAITDALNVICPQAPAGIEHLPSYTGISEAQGLWSFESLHLTDDLIIIAIIKKL